MGKHNMIFLKGYILPFFLFILAILSVWTDRMSKVDVDMSQARFLVYATYFLVIYSVFVILQGGMRQRGFHVVCILWCIVMPVVIFLSHGKLIDYAQTLLWPLIFESSWVIVKANKSNIRLFQKLFYVAFIIGFVVLAMSDRHTEGQTNTVYFSLLTLPWIIFGKKKTVLTIFFIIFTIIVIWSLKRSAMLSLAGSWLIYFLSIAKGRNFVRFLLFLTLFLPLSNYLFDYADREMGGMLSERINKEETDEGSNRLAIYEITMAMIGASSKTELVTGHGHFAVAKHSFLERSAHNDMLEVIYDYGVVVFVLYLCLWIFLVKRSVQLYKAGSELFVPYASSVMIFVIMSSVGHLILYTSYFNYLVMFWGATEVLVSPIIEKKRKPSVKKK